MILMVFVIPTKTVADYSRSVMLDLIPIVLEYCKVRQIEGKKCRREWQKPNLLFFSFQISKEMSKDFECVSAIFIAVQLLW